MNKSTPMPDFTTRDEEADYFDAHFLEEWQEGQPVKIHRNMIVPYKYGLTKR